MTPYLTYAERLIRPLAEQLVREQEKIRVIKVPAEKRLIAVAVRKRIHQKLESQLRAAYPDHFASKLTKSKPNALQSYWRIYSIPELDAYIHGLNYFSMIAVLCTNNRVENVLIYFPYFQFSLAAYTGGGVYHEQRKLRVLDGFESHEHFIASNNFRLGGWRQQLADSSKRLVHTGSLFGDLLWFLTGKVDVLMALKVPKPIAELLDFFVRESAGVLVSSDVNNDNLNITAAASAAMDKLRISYPLQSD